MANLATDRQRVGASPDLSAALRPVLFIVLECAHGVLHPHVVIDERARQLHNLARIDLRPELVRGVREGA